MVSRNSGASTTTNESTSGSSSSNSTENSASSSNSSQNTSGRSTTTGTQKQVTDISSMSSGALAILNQLIASISGGTNAQTNQLQQEWANQISHANQLYTNYSKSAAIVDSQAAMNATLAESLRKAMPTITAGIDAAGTSGSALSALLTQQAAESAAENAAQLGLSAAISYGNIAAQANQTAANLVNTGDPALNALMEALGISKGSVTKGTTTTTNNSTTVNNQTSTSSSSSQSTSNKTANQTGNSNTTSTTGPTKSSTYSV